MCNVFDIYFDSRKIVICSYIFKFKEFIDTTPTFLNQNIHSETKLPMGRPNIATDYL